MERAEIPRQALDLIRASISESTWKQYDKPLMEWMEFYTQSGKDVLDPNTGHVVEFLLRKYAAGAKYGTLNMYRSALAFVLGDKIGKSRWISRLLKGCFRQRPAKPKYDRIYNLEPVLDKIELLFPLENLKLPQLTQRLVILLALVTAHRRQTIALIKVKDIQKTKDGFEIEISERIKTTRPGANQPLLLLPRFEEKPELCVARTLERYLEETEKIRGETQELILTTVKPFGAASKNTISRWLRTFLIKAGIDVEFTPHSIRHAATSAAAKKGIDMTVIKNIAGWSQRSQVFDRFYNRPIVNNKLAFAKAVLR